MYANSVDPVHTPRLAASAGMHSLPEPFYGIPHIGTNGLRRPYRQHSVSIDRSIEREREREFSFHVSDC